MNRGLMNILLMVAFIALIYFMMIRPQRKRDKETKNMRSALSIGDEVVTIGGVVGKIVKIKEEVVVVQVGADKVKIEFLKSAIGNVTKPSAARSAAVSKEKVEEEEEEAKTYDKEKKITPKKISAKKSSDKKEEESDK